MRLERRLDAPRWLDFGVPALSLVAALVAGAVLLLATGNDPLDTYARILDRAFTSADSLSGSLVAATPLLFTGLAAAAAFRVGVFNIGGEGQLILGSVAGSAVGIAWGDSLGAGAIPLMILGGAAGGALFASVPGLLRARFNTNEIITTLMLNYVAINFANYLIYNSRSYWRLLTGQGLVFPQGRPLPEGAHWPPLRIGGLSIPLGYLVGAVLAAGLWVLYRKTRFGFEARIVSDAPGAAEYAGMRPRGVVFAVMCLSGALAGIGGAADIGDTRHVFDAKGLSQAGYGYAGIVVAALARLNPLAVVPVAVLMGGLANAGRALQGEDFPAGLVGALQGLVLFCALGGEVLARYRVRRSSTEVAV